MFFFVSSRRRHTRGALVTGVQTCALPISGPKKPVLDKFVTKIVPEASARRLQLQKGDLDIAADLTVDQLQALNKDKNVRVAKYPSLRVTYLYQIGRASCRERGCQ